MHEIKTNDGHIFQIHEKMRFGLLRKVQKIQLKYMKISDANKLERKLRDGESEDVASKTTGIDMDLSGTMEAQDYYIQELIEKIVTPDGKEITTKTQIMDIFNDIEEPSDGQNIADYCREVFENAQNSSRQLEKKT